VKRGDLYRVANAHHPGRSSVYVVVSKQVLIDSSFPTVVCAPVRAAAQRLATQVALGPEDGVDDGSNVFCDAFVSLPKESLTELIGSVSRARLQEIDRARQSAMARQTAPAA
jgi:mRNA interferase MazF